MAAGLLRFGENARPFSPSRLALALFRIAAIILAVYLIRATRTDGRIDAGLLISLAVFAGLYFIFGRRGELRPVMLYLIFTGCFAQVRLFADQTGIPVQFEYVITIERAIFSAIPTVWLQEQLYRPGESSLITLYSAAVYVSYFLGFQICALVIWIRYRDFFPIYATSVIVAAYIGLMTCIAIPTAPPWLAAQEGYLPPIERIMEVLLDTVDSSAYDGGASVAGVNQVAAMPSLHMALTVLIGLTIWRLTRNPILRTLPVVYAASMAFALVYLGEHYIVDELFGVLTAFVAWHFANLFWAEGRLRLRLRRPTPASAAATPVQGQPVL
jgi:membrane-associated phospholipid phosphatase